MFHTESIRKRLDGMSILEAKQALWELISLNLESCHEKDRLGPWEKERFYQAIQCLEQNKLSGKQPTKSWLVAVENKLREVYEPERSKQKEEGTHSYESLRVALDMCSHGIKAD